ncbi:uncharacterized protein METZ01_LOCUS317873, partial [marine metagenome]
MKLFLSYPLTAEPHGGGNQFLRNLAHEFSVAGILTASPYEADVILYNSHHHMRETLILKKQCSSKTFVHRMDGLQKLYNSSSDRRQDISIKYNKIAKGTIFQSKWSKNEFCKYGFIPSNSEVILNAADPAVFNSNYVPSSNKKIELLCTSFSPNINKGFNFYKLLDQALDFDRFNFTFVGNTPSTVNYKNIRCFPPESTSSIAQRLRETDIFISATLNDCCSNSIIEALSSNVPVLTLNSGGTPELVKDEAMLFENIDDFIMKLDYISTHLDFFKSSIKVDNMTDIAERYRLFFEK